MATLKEINLVHETRESAEKAKSSLAVKTPVYVYEIDGHDGKTWFVIERHTVYAIGALYSEKYGIEANLQRSSKQVTKDDVVEFMKTLSKEEIEALLA